MKPTEPLTLQRKRLCEVNTLATIQDRRVTLAAMGRSERLQNRLFRWRGATASTSSGSRLVADSVVDVRPHGGGEMKRASRVFATQERGSQSMVGEGGVDGTVICDGVTRTQTATVSLSEGSKFRGGPAVATVAFLVSFIDVNGSKVCGQDNDTQPVLVAGRA
jgi:hypothetical protein